MRLHIHHLSLALAALLVGIVFGTGTARAAAEYSVADQGWRIVEQAGERAVELRVLVVNASESPLQHEVRFIVERSELPTQTARAGQPSKEGSQASEPIWSTINTTSVRGDPLAAGTSGLVKTTVPCQLLGSGKAYRFRAELLDVSTGGVLAATSITSLGSPFIGGAGLASETSGNLDRPFVATTVPLGVNTAGPGSRSVANGEPLAVAVTGPRSPSAAAAPLVGPASETSGLVAQAQSLARVSGSGTMSGVHQARRVGGEWVEDGSGTIRIYSPQGSMVLYYTYHSHGPSAATLTATATATGTYFQPKGPALPVKITSASAKMTFPGMRHQIGQVIRRTRATATGTFSGTVGGTPWNGSLQMTDGVQTLNLTTHTGSHSFDIQFTASR